MSEGFASIGNLCIDDLVFVDGSTRWGIPGGNSIYAALGMAVWGERAKVVAPVGPDYPLDIVQHRADFSHCPKIPVTLRNWGLYEEDGTRNFVFRSYCRHWHDFSPRHGDLAGLHPIAAHLAPLPWDLHEALVEVLRRDGTRFLSIDLDDRDLAAVEIGEIAKLMGKVDLFLPSRQDVLTIFPGTEPIEALRRLRNLSPATPLIAVKCGAEGLLAHAAGQADILHLPAVPVEVTDATGAGDTFCGATLAGFVRSSDPLEAALYGAVAASFCVEGLGCAGLVDTAPAQAHSRLEALRQRGVLLPL